MLYLYDTTDEYDGEDGYLLRIDLMFVSESSEVYNEMLRGFQRNVSKYVVDSSIFFLNADGCFVVLVFVVKGGVFRIKIDIDAHYYAKKMRSGSGAF